eukprot:555947-Prymnesium_polylepis.1
MSAAAPSSGIRRSPSSALRASTAPSTTGCASRASCRASVRKADGFRTRLSFSVSLQPCSARQRTPCGLRAWPAQRLRQCTRVIASAGNLGYHRYKLQLLLLLTHEVRHGLLPNAWEALEEYWLPQADWPDPPEVAMLRAHPSLAAPPEDLLPTRSVNASLSPAGAPSAADHSAGESRQDWWCLGGCFGGKS